MASVNASNLQYSCFKIVFFLLSVSLVFEEEFASVVTDEELFKSNFIAALVEQLNVPTGVIQNLHVYPGKYFI